MYLVGVPIGMFVDSRGPRPAVFVGAFLLGLGYLPLERAYDAGQGSVPLLSFASFLTGLGGCMAFAGSVKTSALNWPQHRGTATAFPLAAFGLSAFFFSLVGSVFFPGSPGKFLLLLATGTFGMIFTGFFFLRVLPQTPAYQAVPVESGRPMSSHSRSSRGSFEPGMLPENATATASTSARSRSPGPEQPAHGKSLDMGSDLPVGANDDAHPSGIAQHESEETRLLLSSPTATPSLADDVLVQNSVDIDRSRRVDIRGWDLLTNLEFWQLFIIMGILSGIGLMTIK